MAIKNLDGQNTAEVIKSEVAKASEEAKKLIKYYEDLSGNKVPVSVKAAADGEWRKALSEGAQELLEHYPADMRKADKTHLVKVSDALEILGAFEDEIIKVAVSDAASVLVRPYVVTNQVSSYLIENGAKALGAVADVMNQFRELLLEALKEAVYETFHHLFGFVKIVGIVARLAFKLAPIFVAGATAVTGALMAGTLVAVVTKAFNKVDFRVGVKPIIAARQRAEQKLRAKVLFRADGKRYSRRKRAR